MTYKFTIYGRLPSLNEYTRACRTNPHVGAQMKKKAETDIMWQVKEKVDVKIEGPVTISYLWIEPNTRRDLENIAFAKKFLQDSLVNLGILQGDGWKHIVGFSDAFDVDKDRPRIEVTIETVE